MFQLLRKPHFFDCKSNVLCRSNNCGKKHHRLLHNPSADTVKNSKRPAIGCQRAGQAPYLPNELSYSGRTIYTNVSIDNGSSLTLLLKTIATELGLDNNNKKQISNFWMSQDKMVQVASVEGHIRPYNATRNPLLLEDILIVLNSDFFQWMLLNSLRYVGGIYT